MTMFEPGEIVATRGVASKMEKDPEFTKFVSSSFDRHLTGDWGEVCKEDSEANQEALKEGYRLVSVYKNEDTKVYIITEHDRSVTTILFPEEY